MKLKRYLLYIMLICIMFLVGCGNNASEKDDTELIQGTEETQETETEFRVEIADAEDILLKTWNAYKTEDHFKIMGGHFTSAVVGLPAKYDLTQTTDLVQMYCFPENQIETIDDAATMIDLYNAARFTAGVYHIFDVASVQSVVDEIKNQVSANEWHGEKPEKLYVIKVDERYVVSVYGREPLVELFKQNLVSLYQTMVEVVIEEKLF